MKLEFYGFEGFLDQLQRISDDAEHQCRRVLWEGARVVADEIHNALQDIPVQDEYVKKGQKRTGITSDQKEGIQAAFGLSRMKTKAGSVDISAGFDGETDGVKNSTLMRRVESGTSYMHKHPIIRPAVQRAQDKAVDAMQKRYSEDINNILKQ